MTEDDTVPVSPTVEGEHLKSTLELWLRTPRGALRVVPFHRSTMSVGPATAGRVDLELSEGPLARLTYREGKVFYNNQTPAQEIFYNRQPSQFGPLEVGGTLQLGRYQLQLWDRGGPQAYLEGYSEPYAGTLWPLTQQHHMLGRPGRRANFIALDHPTVSREHATLKLDGENASVLAESSTNLVSVNGQTLEAGHSGPLSDGDLLEIGSLLFRFRYQPQTPKNEAPPLPLLQVTSLGSFHITLGDEVVLEKAWRTQNVKWLLARLAFSWGKPLGVEAVMELLWPEATLEKGRNNLNYSVSTLRQMLRAAGEPLEYVLRTSQWLQLNPDYLGEHDVVVFEHELEKANRARSQNDGATAKASFSRALELYQGPFLEGCYLDWAVQTREVLQMQALEAGRALLGLLWEDKDADSVLEVGPRVLRMDSCCQTSYLTMMQAHIGRGGPEEALRLYESCCKSLHRELGVEPSMDILREYHRAQALL